MDDFILIMNILRHKPTKVKLYVLPQNYRFSTYLNNYFYT